MNLRKALSFGGLSRLLLVGLAIREALAPFTGHPFDFEIWVRLGAYMQSGANPYTLLPFIPGLSFSPYPYLTSISYPPLSAFIFGGTYWVYQALGSPSPYLYYFLLKQPMVISDLLAAVFLLKLSEVGGSGGVGRKVATIWIFLPLGIIVSSMWGALDPFALLLVLASVYMWKTKRPVSSAVLLGASIYLKLMPVIFLPLFLLERNVPLGRKAVFSALSLGIPLLGTVIPVIGLSWGFYGIGNAVSYQGSLPSFGGMGAFNVLSLFGPIGGPVASALSLAWLAALLAAYVYAFARRLELIPSMLVAVLAFSIFRPTMPEQWALYPLAFLLLMWDKGNRTHFIALAGAATSFLVVNNLLLVRFFTPLSWSAFTWDQFVDNGSSVSLLRYALLLVISTLFTAEALSVIAKKSSVLASKVDGLGRLKPRNVAVPLGYLGLVATTGGVLDFTATKMVTDWGLAMESKVFLGLGWLSLYHIMLVVVFETMTVFVVLFSRRSTSERIGLFLLLTSLNIAASAIALVIYRALDGTAILSGTTIYLVSSVYLTESAFVVFGLTLSALVIVFLDELRTLVIAFFRRIAQIPSTSRVGPEDANSLPPPA